MSKLFSPFRRKFTSSPSHTKYLITEALEKKRKTDEKQYTVTHKIFSDRSTEKKNFNEIFEQTETSSVTRSLCVLSLLQTNCTVLVTYMLSCQVKHIPKKSGISCEVSSRNGSSGQHRFFSSVLSIHFISLLVTSILME